MKVKSTATKFKLITGKDLMFVMKGLDKESKGEGEHLTELMEFIQYGLHLAFYNVDLAKAKKEFSEFMETSEMEDDIESFEKLTAKWSKEFKG